MISPHNVPANMFALTPNGAPLLRLLFSREIFVAQWRFQRAASNMKHVKKLTKLCKVCGDKAASHNHYGGTACYSCRAFFRRCCFTKIERHPCKNDIEDRCVINMNTRRNCIACRFNKCLQVGMKREWIMTMEEKRELQIKKKLASKEPTSYDQRMKWVDWQIKKKEKNCSSWQSNNNLQNRMIDIVSNTINMQSFNDFDPPILSQLLTKVGQSKVTKDS